MSRESGLGARVTLLKLKRLHHFGLLYKPQQQTCNEVVNALQ
jgi:hypothetical protein